MWDLGNANETLAKRDKSGNGKDLVKVGSPNYTAEFKRGRYSLTSLTTANYFRAPVNTTQQLDGTGELVQYSYWVYYDTAVSGDRQLVSNLSSNGSGTYYSFSTVILSSSNTISIRSYSGSQTGVATSGTLTDGTWNHIVIQAQTSTYLNLFVNGVKYTGTLGVFGVSGTTTYPAFYVGVFQDGLSTDSSISGTAHTNSKIADLIAWRDGPLLTQAQVNALYNAGAPVPTGFFPVVRNEYALTGQSGQKLSMKATLDRTTTAVSPAILDLGAIKT
jgi:hypothetical protein